MAGRTDFQLLIQLSILIYSVNSCVVDCTTDYKTLLNCSCSGLEPPETLLLQVYCRYEELVLNENCSVSVQQPFCVMYPRILEEIADIETECRAIAFRAQDHSHLIQESPHWKLSLAVRPWPPLHVHVNMTKSFYNISWVNKNSPDCLTFRMQIRACHGKGKSEFLQESTQSFVLLKKSRLLPALCHRVNVQAKVCPDSPYKGPWSEWSVTTFWTTAAGPPDTHSTGLKHYYWLITLPFLLILLLACPKAMLWQKRFQVMAYIPNPGEYFKPLYITYHGNFKAWVKPAFAEHHSLTDPGADLKLDHWHRSFPDFSPVHSIVFGSISVTSDPHSPETSDDSPEVSGDVCQLVRSPINLSTLRIIQDIEEEELTSSEYPLMDLDTIDSGFGECSSPPLCNPETTKEQLTVLYHSNYVKQWTTGETKDQGIQTNIQRDMYRTGEQ